MQLTRQIIPVAVVSLFVLAAVGMPWAEIYAWAAGAQREFQNAMARGLRAVQGGDPIAVISLYAATFAYGFVHALGPGHGKIILGGAAVASQATLQKMVILAAVSALAQAMAAIVVVLALVGGFSLLTSASAIDVAERWLAPLSYGAFVLIGSVILWRGVHILIRPMAAAAPMPQRCTHSNGPSANQIETLSGWRDSAVVVASVAVRPCTGALFLLVIAARFDMLAVGIIATLAMGSGTAAFNAVVAISGVVARRLVHSGETQSFWFAPGLLHLIGGALIISLSLMFLLPLLPG